MTEKINGQGLRPADAHGLRRTAATKPGGTAAAGRSSNAPTGERVELTPTALLLKRLEEALQAFTVIDPERVRAAKDALASGQYKIDEQRVADQLLRTERELLA